MSSTLSYSMFKGRLNNTNITFTIQPFRPQLQDNLSSDIKPSIGKVVHELQNLTYNLQPIIAQSLLFSCAVQYFSWVEDLIALSQLPLIASGSSGLAAFKASGSVVSQLICVGWLGRPPPPYHWLDGWGCGAFAGRPLAGRGGSLCQKEVGQLCEGQSPASSGSLGSPWRRHSLSSSSVTVQFGY